MVTATTTQLAAGTKAPLAERLGYKATDKLLIINGDDAGMCLTANQATIESLESGLMRTSDGYMWKDVPDVYQHATPEQALIEGRAQVQRALAAGVDVTHLDSHMGTMQLHPDYVKAYLQLAVEFDLPVRMASQETLTQKGFPQLRDAFSARGIVFPDHFVYDELKDENKGVKEFWLGIVKNLKPGVTELYIHAGLPTDELKAITGSWQTRSQEFEVFTRDEEMKRLVKEQNIILIGYRPLRDLQRTERQQSGK